VIEPHDQQAPTAHLVAPTTPSARAHLSVQVGDRGSQAVVVSAHHCPAFALIPERVQHADVLDRPQH
jgi:hypothetical protein